MGHVRRARPVERPALERLMVDATAAWGYSEEFMAAVRRNAQVDHDAIADGRCLVVAADEQVRGFVTIEVPERDRCELTDLFVRPEHWREGIGRRLTAAAAAMARELGAKTMWTIGGPASPFYQRMGFVVVGETSTPLGPPGQLIELSLL